MKRTKKSMAEYRIATSGYALIEPMVEGNDFRVLVLEENVIACCQRIPAHIIGDGKHSAKELIDRFNRTRPSHFQLTIDTEVKNSLKQKGLSLQRVIGDKKFSCGSTQI